MYKVIGFFFVLCFTNITIAANSTANYWQCNHKVGGKWTFGQIPNACDIAPFAAPSEVKAIYQAAIFDTTITDDTSRYMQVMYGVIRDISKQYLLKRKASASNEEIKQWQRAVFSIAHQESFWSHYREASDGRLKMVRGDYGHGHGLMQIDDRWHYLKVKNDGVGWDLVKNLVYALDIYYTGWQRAPQKSCVASSQSWRNRSRAAYAAYNGGAAKICRFTDVNNRWAKNDRNFVDKYDQQGWLTKVADTNKTAALNIACLMENNTNCPTVNNHPIAEKQLMQLQDGAVCLLKGETLHCLADIDDQSCLTLLDTFDANIIQVSNTLAAKYQRQNYDRHLCSTNLATVFNVGDTIISAKAINMRATPAGEKVATSQLNKTYQILDFVLKGTAPLKRYYKIRENNIEGYIYAGDNDSYQQWANLTDEPANEQMIPQIGDWVEITASNGINVRDAIGGSKLTTIANGEQVEVLERVVKTANNRLYYKIQIDNMIGYIYAGWLQPDNTINAWAKLIDTVEITSRTGQGGNIWYTNLKLCGADDCASMGNYLIGQKLGDACNTWGCSYKTDKVIELGSQENGWVKIKVLRDNGIGWVKATTINWD